MTEQHTFEVKGMSCGHCVKAIEESVGAMDGVQAVQVHLDAGTVDIAFDNDLLNAQQITDTIEEQGYDVVK